MKKCSDFLQDETVDETTVSLPLCVCASVRTNRTLIWILWPVAVCLLAVMESLLNMVESLFWKGC